MLIGSIGPAEDPPGDRLLPSGGGYAGEIFESLCGRVDGVEARESVRKARDQKERAEGIRRAGDREISARVAHDGQRSDEGAETRRIYSVYVPAVDHNPGSSPGTALAEGLVPRGGIGSSTQASLQVHDARAARVVKLKSHRASVGRRREPEVNVQTAESGRSPRRSENSP